MRLPFQKKKIEKRASYSQQVADSLFRAALTSNADIAATSPAVAAAGLLGRSLSAATVTPQSNRTAGLTPAFLYDVGQSLVFRGEHLSLIDVSDGTVRLTPAVEWEIVGTSPYKENWRYKLQLPTPNGVVKRSVSGLEVAHIRIPDGGHPWEGSSLLVQAGLTASGMAALEDFINQETTNSARARIVNVPGFEDSDDSEDDPWNDFIDDVRTAKSKTLLTPAPAGMIQGVAASSTSPQFGTLHLRPEIPEDLQTLRDRLTAGLYAALGMMPQLFEGGEATGIREAKRAFHNLTLLPLARLCAAELSDVLDEDVTLTFESLQLGAIREAASTAKMLVDMGVDQAKALELAGLSS